MSDRNTYQISNGLPRRVYGARDRLQRDSQALVVQTTEGGTAKDQPGAWWITDLRRGRRSIYGGLLRFIGHLHRRGVSLETALLIPIWLERYIREVWSASPPSTPAIPLHLMTTGETEKAAA